jgi:hypothetical protein
MNFNDNTVTWDTDIWHYSNEDRYACSISSVEALIEAYISANEP